MRGNSRERRAELPREDEALGWGGRRGEKKRTRRSGNVARGLSLKTTWVLSKVHNMIGEEGGGREEGKKSN